MSLTTVCIITFVVAFILHQVFGKKDKTQVEAQAAIAKGETPVSLPMAVHHENAKFRVRYRNLIEGQELYDIGLRNGQFGMILRHKSGMFAKTTVNGKCHFVHINYTNYVSTENT